MNDNEDVSYTFYESPKFLSPKPDRINDKLDGIDESSIKINDKVLNKVASKFSPKKSKHTIFDREKRNSSKRRTSKKRKSPKRKRNSKKSPKRRRSKKR